VSLKNKLFYHRAAWNADAV